MTSSSHEFVTANLRGLKAALVACAQSERVSVSAIVRRAVESELSLQGPTPCNVPISAGDPVVKLSIRLRTSEAERLSTGAQRAGLSRGAFLAQVVTGVPAVVGTSMSRPDCIAALTSFSAELATLSRSIHNLIALLCQGSSDGVREYRSHLNSLDERVREHLHLAAEVLAHLRPSARNARDAGLRGPGREAKE
jgi:hypothetical protein